MITPFTHPSVQEQNLGGSHTALTLTHVPASRSLFSGLCSQAFVPTLTSRALQRWDCVGKGTERTLSPGSQGSELESSPSPVLLSGNSELPRDSLLIYKVGLLCSLDIRVNQKWPPSDCVVPPPTPSITTTKPASGTSQDVSVAKAPATSP